MKLFIQAELTTSQEKPNTKTTFISYGNFQQKQQTKQLIMVIKARRLVNMQASHISINNQTVSTPNILPNETASETNRFNREISLEPNPASFHHTIDEHRTSNTSLLSRFCSLWLIRQVINFFRMICCCKNPSDSALNETSNANGEVAETALPFGTNASTSTSGARTLEQPRMTESTIVDTEVPTSLPMETPSANIQRQPPFNSSSYPPMGSGTEGTSPFEPVSDTEDEHTVFELPIDLSEMSQEEQERWFENTVRSEFERYSDQITNYRRRGQDTDYLDDITDDTEFEHCTSLLWMSLSALLAQQFNKSCNEIYAIFTYKQFSDSETLRLTRAPINTDNGKKQFDRGLIENAINFMVILNVLGQKIGEHGYEDNLYINVYNNIMSQLSIYHELKPIPAIISLHSTFLFLRPINLFCEILSLSQSPDTHPFFVEARRLAQEQHLSRATENGVTIHD